MIDLPKNVASCSQLLGNRSGAGAPEQTVIIAESLLRSFEIRKYVADEFRRSRRGLTWVANSKNEVGQSSYLEVVTLFNRVAEDLGDLRFVNASLKILDAKLSDETSSRRDECLQLVSKIIHA